MPIHNTEPQQRVRKIARLGLSLEKTPFFQTLFCTWKVLAKFTQPREVAGRCGTVQNRLWQLKSWKLSSHF